MEKLCHHGILCFDPGWQFGCTVVSLDQERPKPIFVDVYVTDPIKKKSNIRKADDDARRADEIWEWLESIARRIDVVVAVFYEAGVAGKSSRAVSSMGQTKQIAECFARHLNVPKFHASAQAVKKAATAYKDSKGRNNASKEEVQDAITKRVPYLDWQRFTKRELDDAVDSCAVFLACWRYPELQAFLRVLRDEQERENTRFAASTET